jgi:hypothetical protein
MPIKPGITVYIDPDPSTAKAKALRASVFDVSGNRVTLSQTSPPLPASLINRPVAVSFISKTGDRTRRLGFIGVITGIIEDFELASRTRVPAILLDRKKDLKSITMRRSARVQPPEDGSFRLAIRGGSYGIFDISVHGMNFIQPPHEEAFAADEVFNLSLTIDEAHSDLRAKVIRTFEREGLRHVAIDFVDLDGEVEDILAIKLFALEMQSMLPDAH